MKVSKNFIFFTLMLVFTFCGMVAILEIGMRVFHVVPRIHKIDQIFMADPFLPYKMRPGLKLLNERSATDEFTIDTKTNSVGFRDVEHAYEKSDNTFRILGLGDSFTFGYGAQFEETYLYQLETFLNQRAGKHQKVEIIKAGIGKYFPESERLLLQYYGKKYAPDLILVGFLPNDVVDTHEGIDAVAVDPSGFLTSIEAKSLGRTGVILYTNSYLCRYALKKYISNFVAKHKSPPGDWQEIYKPNGFYEKDWQTIESEYQKMITLAAEMKARIVFIHIPQNGPWDKTHFYPAQRLSAFAEKQGAGFVDILPGMIEASADKILYYEKDGHCTPQGYMVIAQKLYAYLMENNLIP